MQVTERVLTMQEKTLLNVAKLIATMTLKRGHQESDIVKFRQAMQAQTEEEAHKVNKLPGQPKISVFKQRDEGQ